MTAWPVVLLGHVDHGKSTVFRALAGAEVRRRENARGNTFDFSVAVLDGDVTVVDVPGHRDYRANTFAAVAGAGAFVLVVAADEGPAPQTWDHWEFARAAGLRRGFVVWTKTDRVTAVELEVRRRAMREAFAARGAGVGEGDDWVLGDARALDREALRPFVDRLVSLAKREEENDDERGWLWIDRAFVSRAGGRVVTGTWRGGEPLERGATLFAGAEAHRVRAIEHGGVPVETAALGARVALAISGAEARSRGDRLLLGHGIHPVGVADVRCAPLGDALRAGSTCEVWLGPSGGLASVDGRRGDVLRLRFARPLPAAVGDRLVLRDGGGAGTLAHAFVIEPDPRRPFRKVATLLEASPRETFLLRRGVIREAEWRAHSLRRDVPMASTSERRWREAIDAVLATLDAAEKPLETRDLRSVPAVRELVLEAEEALLRDLARHPAIRCREGLWWTASLERPDGNWAKATAALVRRIDAETFVPDGASKAEREMLRWLFATGRVVRWDESTFETRERCEAFLRRVGDVLGDGAVRTLGELRERLGLSRREAVRRFEALDRWGVTERSGDGRKLLTSCSGPVPSPD